MNNYLKSLLILLVITVGAAVSYSDSIGNWKHLGLIGFMVLGYVLADWANMKEKLTK